MNANKIWKQYNTFHKLKTAQHTPPVYKALKGQLEYFAQTRDIDGIPVAPIAQALKNIYIDAGPKWAFQTYLSVLKEAGIKPRKKDLNGAISLKAPRLPGPRMPIGFNEDFVNAMLEFLGVDFLNTAEDIADTTKEFIRRQLQAGLSAGEDLDFIIRGILNSGQTATRAALIARTEVAKASNYGEQVGTDKTGLETSKEWLSVRDHRTRFDHVTADGQTVPDGQPFIIGVEGFKMERPGATKGTDGRPIPGKEVCNCRCTVGRHVLMDDEGLPVMKPGAG